MKKHCYTTFFFILFLISSLSAQIEICGNNIDDDRDGQVDEACSRFECDKKLYVTLKNELLEINMDPFSHKTVLQLPFGVNCTGYSAKENLIYSNINDDSSPYNDQLVRIDADGNYEILGPILNEEGIPIHTYSGDIGQDGKLYALDRHGPSGTTLYSVNVQTMETKKILVIEDGSMATDIACNPINGFFYGITSEKTLLKLDVGNGKAYNEGTLLSDEFFDQGSVGAVYFNPEGELIAYGSFIYPEDLDDIVKVNVNTLETELLLENTIENHQMDGCSCAFNIYMEKTAQKSEEFPNEIIYTIDIYNETRGILEFPQLVDTIDSRFKINRIQYNELGALAKGTGIGHDVVVIENMSLKVGKSSIRFHITPKNNVVCNDIEVQNQAYLINLPSSYGTIVMSNDPETAEPFDPTKITFEKNFSDSSAQLNWNYINACGNIDTILEFRGIAEKIIWEESADSLSWNLFQGKMINDYSINVQHSPISINSIIKYYKATVFSCDTIELFAKAIAKPQPLIELRNDTSICEYEALPVKAITNGEQFWWNTGENSLDIIAEKEGTYTFNSRLNGCNYSKSFNLHHVKLPTGIFQSSTLKVCAEDRLSIEVNKESFIDLDPSFFWRINNEFVSFDPYEIVVDTFTIDADVQVHVTFGHSCLDGQTITENVAVNVINDSRLVTPNIDDTWGCLTEELFLHTTNKPDGINVEWYDAQSNKQGQGDTLFINKDSLEEGNTYVYYAVFVNDDKCESDYEKSEIIIQVSPESPVIGGDSVLCIGDENTGIYIASENVQNSTVWYKDDSIVSSNDTLYLQDITTVGIQNYEAIVRNEYCPSFPATFSVNFRDLPPTSIHGDTTVCVGATLINYSVDSILKKSLYTWSITGKNGLMSISSPEDPSVGVTWNNAGVDSIFIEETDRFGCRNFDTLTIYVAPYPEADFISRSDFIESMYYFTNTSQQDSIKISDESNLDINVSYFWDFEPENIMNQPIIQVQEEYRNVISNYYSYGNYEVELLAVNELGCRDSIRKPIFMDAVSTLFIPNSFVPDFQNREVQLFMPKGENLKKYEIWVYDVWGNIIWHSNKLGQHGQPTEAWDGTCNGVLLKSDVYIWKAEAEFKNGKLWDGMPDKSGQYKKYGNVFLIR